MTRQRKTHLLILALVPVVVFTAVRCADSTGAPAPAPALTTGDAAIPAAPSTRLAKLRQQYGGVGKDHNDALAFVLKKLQRLPAKNRSHRAICETARTAFADFHRMRFGRGVPASPNTRFTLSCEGVSPAGTRVPTVTASDNPVRADYSPAALSYFDQIAAAVDISSSLEELASLVASIEASAAASLSYEEAGTVMMVGSVAISSAEYWVQYILDWDPYLLSNTGYSIVQSVVPATSGTAGRRGDWASIWASAKAAAKRAVGGDVRAAAKTLIAIGAASAAYGFPIAYDMVVTGAAIGSIDAVLEL